MKVVGLTGSIGMGKTFVADIFQSRGIGVFDADKEIHDLIESGGKAVAQVLEKFPEADNKNGGIDRTILGQIVFADKGRLAELEAILHPMVRQAGDDFLKEQQGKNAKMIVKDIPLLFETGANKTCDVTIVVEAPVEVQKERVLAREGMTEDKYNSIMRLQLPSDTKKELANYVIDTGVDKAGVESQVDKIIEELSK